MSGVPNCITQQILASSKHMRGKLVLMFYDQPMVVVVACNIGSVQHLVGEEQIRFICATGSWGHYTTLHYTTRSARAITVYTVHDLVPLPACTENR